MSILLLAGVIRILCWLAGAFLTLRNPRYTGNARARVVITCMAFCATFGALSTIAGVVGLISGSTIIILQSLFGTPVAFLFLIAAILIYPPPSEVVSGPPRPQGSV